MKLGNPSNIIKSPASSPAKQKKKRKQDYLISESESISFIQEEQKEKTLSLYTMEEINKSNNKHLKEVTVKFSFTQF